MLAQARAELPNECCGLLAGRIQPQPAGSALALVERHYPLVNEEASPTKFLSEPVGMFQAARDMRRQGTEILAVYHSHPSSDPIPSKTDLAMNYSEEIMNLIISLAGQEPIMRAWWLKQSCSEEGAWQIV